jgi:predicted NAD/FAD-binding protein
MPFEQGAGAPKTIAVIGAGISGMGAAYMLSDANAVTLYESEPRLGGHARTIMAGKRGDQPVDTGFIVFNRVNYPHLVQLFERLDVPIADSAMSFGASFDGGRFEYALNSLDALFAQRRNAVDPRFWRMVRDILRFNARAEGAVAGRDLTIGDLIVELGLGAWFRDRYLLPFSGAIWSTPTHRMTEFPARAMVGFFRNHNLLSHTGQHQWFTVRGGSTEYVSRLGDAMRRKGVDLRLRAPVETVRRTALGVQVKPWGGAWETYDEVVFATHSDDTLAMLSDADAEERAVLGAIRYQPNSVVLHADARMMPRRRNVWSSWVYTEDSERRSDEIDITYWMNSLQPIPQDDPMFVTLNTKRQIRDELIYDQTTLRHPVYDAGALAAQARIPEINGNRNTWFCGAWVKNGFHEDGLSSAVDVVEALSRRAGLQVVAA